MKFLREGGKGGVRGRVCEVGGRFSRCHFEAADSCQFCGRFFCAQHLYFREGHEAVCTRKQCQAKQDDMVIHGEYRAGVEQRNRARLCGLEECETRPDFECSLCQGHFCDVHVRSRMYPFNNGYSTVDRPASVCDRCWRRRKLWRRR
jgi:hypothetical protein